MSCFCLLLRWVERRTMDARSGWEVVVALLKRERRFGGAFLLLGSIPSSAGVFYQRMRPRERTPAEPTVKTDAFHRPPGRPCRCVPGAGRRCARRRHTGCLPCMSFWRRRCHPRDRYRWPLDDTPFAYMSHTEPYPPLLSLPRSAQRAEVVLEASFVHGERCVWVVHGRCARAGGMVVAGCSGCSFGLDVFADGWWACREIECLLWVAERSLKVGGSPAERARGGSRRPGGSSLHGGVLCIVICCAEKCLQKTSPLPRASLLRHISTTNHGKYRLGISRPQPTAHTPQPLSTKDSLLVTQFRAITGTSYVHRTAHTRPAHTPQIRRSCKVYQEIQAHRGRMSALPATSTADAYDCLGCGCVLQQ